MRRALALVPLVLSIACGAASPPREERVTRLAEEGWTDASRARLERALADLGARSGRRVAVFDWDNTMIRGDIGDLVLAHAIERDRLIAPAWSELVMLTDAARAELAAACAVAPGEPLPTAGGASDCARTIARLAWDGTTRAGEPGFTTPIAPTYRATYGFLVQMLAGHDDAALRALAREAWDAAEAMPVGARAEVAGVEVERFARWNAPMRELVRALGEAGLEVWIVSASAQPIVEELAARAGIPGERVIGVRVERDAGGRATARFEWSEGGVPVISWHEGKRRWIERVIGARPLLAAGDSDGDLAMLQDAEVRLVLDRHAVRVMCNALADPDGWIVQPLFHDPPAPRTEPYPCASHTDALGGIVDARGRPIADQRAGRVDDR